MSVLRGRLVGGCLGGISPSVMGDSDIISFDQARYILPEKAEQQGAQHLKQKVQDHKSTVVKFRVDHEYHQILHRDDYSATEIVNTWYSGHEIKCMRKENREFLATFVSSIQPRNSHKNIRPMDDDSDSDSSCATIPPPPPLSLTDDPLSTIRGLEAKTAMGSLRRRRHRMQAWGAVFSEQRLQRRNRGDNCPHIAALAIAEAYLEIAEPCQLAAHMLALRDAKDVQDNLRKDRNVRNNRGQDKGSEQKQSEDELHHCFNEENFVESSREEHEDLRNDSVPHQVIASNSCGRIAAPLGIRDTNQTLSPTSSHLLNATYPLNSRRRVIRAAVLA